MAARMAARRTAAEREREGKEAAQRNARRSLRLGTAGVIVLFLSGLAVWLLPDFVFVFIGGLVVGILLILAAFLMVRGSVLAFRPDDRERLL